MADEEKIRAWNNPCWLCLAVAGTAKASVVTEADELLVIAAPLALNPGHTLIVPRRHFRDIYELPDELAAPILQMASRVARAAKRAFTADGMELRQYNELAGGQEIFHFHLHVTPRFVNDGERFNAPPRLLTREQQEASARLLRDALEGTR